MVASHKTHHAFPKQGSKNPLHLPKVLNVQMHTNTCTQMFTAALYRTAKTKKQPKCPSVGDEVNAFWCVHTENYYSAF